MCLSKVTHYLPDADCLRKAGFKQNEEGMFIGYRTKDTMNGHKHYRLGQYDNYRYTEEKLQDALSGFFNEEQIRFLLDINIVRKLIGRQYIAVESGQVHASGFFLFKSLKDAEYWNYDGMSTHLIKVLFSCSNTTTLGYQQCHSRNLKVAIVSYMEVVEII